MKIIEAVRLGVLGVARLSAGLAFALWLTAGVAVPAVASEDWKAEVLSEFADVEAALSEKLEKSEGTGAKYHMARAMYQNMSGLCTGFASGFQIPTPKPIVELSAAIHSDFMRGELPSEDHLTRLGRLCLEHAVQNLTKIALPGTSQDEVEEFLAVTLKERVREVREIFGLDGFSDNNKGEGQ